MAEPLRDAGLDRLRLKPAALPAFVAQNAGAFWFSVVRHPYARAISNYYNKLSRYTQRFEPAIYWRGKLRQILEGPGAWSAHTRGIRHMQRMLDFERFIEGLARNGVDFDIHFRPQSRQLHVDEIPFDEVLKLKDYESGMRRVLDAVGIGEPEGVLAVSRPLNASSYEGAERTLLTPRSRELLHRIYRTDFDTFGYTP